MATALLGRSETQTRKRGTVSAQEYLRADSAADRRSEWVDGEMIPMAGATRTHVQIVTNLVYELQSQLRDRDCSVFSNDTRVRATQYYYPDCGVVCGDYLVDNLHIDTLTNPTVIIEVLSDSTETIDRGTKRKNYLRLPSLRAYLLISQYEPLVEQYVRADESEEWRFIETEGSNGVVELPAIDCRLALRDIYRRISLLNVSEPTNKPAEGEKA